MNSSIPDYAEKIESESSQWSLVIGQWSLVIGQWSLVISH